MEFHFTVGNGIDTDERSNGFKIKSSATLACSSSTF